MLHPNAVRQRILRGAGAFVSEDFLPKVARGDMAAVEQCIDRYGALIWSIARRFCANPADAEDAVQDVFIALWRNADRYDPARASEVTFVAMITRRRLIDRRRSAKRQGDRASDSELVDLPSRDDLRMESANDARVANQVIQELPEERRHVLNLAIYEGLTHDQIAGETGLPLGTVKSHVRRGLLSVREKLSDALGMKQRRVAR
jgi:RNA polymerase sigma factor (sigma-70 family)